QAGGQTLGLALSEPLTLVLGDDIDLGLTNARLSLNDQTLQASGRVRLADRLRADLMVSGETLDLRPLTSAAPDTESDSSREVDFSALESIDLEFRLDLDQLLVSDALTLTDVVSETRLQAGRLALAPLQARLFGGAFNGRVDVDFTQAPPAVTVQPELSGIAIDQLAALSGAAAPLSGLADAQLDLDFSGMDLPSILASMNGAGRIEIANGALEGVDLRRLISEELTVSNLSNVSQAFGGRTDFDTLEAGVEVVDGVLELPDLNLAAADFGVQGQGRVDFAADRIDYRLQLNLGPELTQRLPGTLRDATRGRIPLAIAGPVAQPIVTIDFNSLLESALRRQITERLLAPRVEDGDETPSGDEGQTDSASSDEASAEGTSEEEPERERTSQLLLRGLLERALEDDEEASDETETEEGGDEPPPS
ncbi:MAG: AsmA-like C-terminal region-containing protein, partial [Pseudomonadota bacterium]